MIEMSEVGKHSYIDGILSTYFDECSIAAADAACLAHERMQKGEVILRDVQPVGLYRSKVLEEFELRELDKIPIDHEAVVGGKAMLALATHPKIDDLPVRLVAIFNEDTMLPIASFERRTNGQCSYTQLGQEIDEDALVVTANAPRSEYVEAIRTLLANGVVKEYSALVEDLTKTEIDKYRAEIDCARAPAVCRLAEAYFDDTKQIKHNDTEEIYILNDEFTGEGTPKKKYLTKSITLTSDENDVRKIYGGSVRLVLARELQQTTEQKKIKKGLRRTKSEITTEVPVGNMQLLAVVRGGVGVRLMQFSESGVVTLDNYDQMADEETLGKIMQVLPLESEQNRQILREIKIKYYEAKHHKKNVIISSKGEISVGNIYNDGYYHSEKEFNPFSYEDWGGFKRSVVATAFNLNNQTRSALKSNDDEILLGLCAQLGVVERLESFLGPGDTPTERLITKLGGLVVKNHLQFIGVLRDRKAGKTQTDVDAGVSITNGNGRLRVQICGRPSSLEGFEPVTLFDETLRLDAKNTIPDDKISEIDEVISAICVPPAKVK